MKLEIFLSFLLLLAVWTLGGEAIVQHHKQVLLHDDVTISYVPTEKMDTASSTWKFDRNGEQITILTINRNSEYVYDSKFKGRLQKSENSFTLTIRDLTMEDAGIYTINVVQKDGKTESYSCNVTVYEPIPEPNIEKNDVRKTNDQCNFTLHCSVPSNISNLVYEWKYRDGNSAKYQPYHNGSTILLSLPLDHQDMEILCVVHNPVNANSSFIQVQEICKFSGSTPGRSHMAILISVLTLVLISLFIPIIFIRLTKKCEPKKEPKQSINEELNYIEVTTHRRDLIIPMENAEYMGTPAPQKCKAETLYTMLQHPQPKHT